MTGQHPPLLDGPTQWPMWKLRIKSKFDSRNVAGFAYGKVARYTTMTGTPSASVVSAQADVFAKNLTKIGKILEIFDELDGIKSRWVLCQS